MKANAVGKGLSVANRAYTAGFLDADGAIMATIEKHGEKKFGWRVRVTVKITQKGDEVIKWFHQSYKIGYIRKNHTTHEWIIRDQQVAVQILTLLLPYMKVKKRQAEMSIRIIKTQIKTQRDLYKVAHLADALSLFNVRSKNRRKNFTAMIQGNTSSND